MKPMTLKECKKEEKADREFQKKFKVSSTERFRIPLTSLLLPRKGAVHRRDLAIPGQTCPMPHQGTPRSDWSRRPFCLRGACFFLEGKEIGAAWPAFLGTAA